MDVKSRYIQILRDNGIQDEITQVDIVVPELHGDHFASSCDYVTAHRENGEPIELFVKRLIDNPAYSKMLKDMKVFEKEAGFFQEVLPELQRVIKSRVSSDTEYNSNFGPKCYFANEDTIVMENLVKRGYVLLDKHEFQDSETARMVLKNLAKFHAPSYVLLSEEISANELLAKYPCLEDSFSFEGGSDLLREWLESCFRVLSRILRSHECENQEANQKFVNDVAEDPIGAMQSYFELKDDDLTRVINHGDCWNNNMMFEQDPLSKKLLGQVFVDFQVIHIGSPNLDIAYYLFTSVKAEVRQKEWKKLLQFYFDSLVESVQALKGSVPFSFEEFLEDFKRKFIPGFIFGLCSGGVMEAMGDTGNLDEIQGDAMAHINDVIVKWVENNPEKVKEKAKDVSALFEEYRHILSN